MSQFENPPDPASVAPPSPVVPARPSPARWIAAAAAGIAVALFAMPFLLGDRQPSSSSSSSLPGATRDAAGTCTAKRTPAKLDFTVKDMKGADVRLADFKGKVILLNYWATWCGPCKVEIPDLVALQDQYKDQGVVVLGVSQDDDPETLRTFASTYKMNYPVLVGRDAPELLDAQGPLWGLPTSYIIGRDGVICTRHLGPATKEEFERELKAVL